MDGVNDTSSFSNSSSTPVYCVPNGSPVGVLVGLFFAGMTVGVAISSTAAALIWKFLLRRKRSVTVDDSSMTITRSHSKRLDTEGNSTQSSRKYDHMSFGNEVMSVEREIYQSLHTSVGLQQSLPIYQDPNWSESPVKPIEFIGNTNAHDTQQIKQTPTPSASHKVNPLKEAAYPDSVCGQETANTYFTLEKSEEWQSTENDGTFLPGSTYNPACLSLSSGQDSIKLGPVVHQTGTVHNTEEPAYFILEKQENSRIASKMDACDKESINAVSAGDQDSKDGICKAEEKVNEYPQSKCTGPFGTHTDDDAAQHKNESRWKTETINAKETKPKKQLCKRKPTYVNIEWTGNTGNNMDREGTLHQYNSIQWVDHTNAGSEETNSDIMRSPTYQNVHK